MYNLSKTKYNVGIALVVSLTAFLMTASPVLAAPAFNIFEISFTPQTNKDLPMLDARDMTQGNTSFSTTQADHDNGVTVNPGDVIEFQIYYHNGSVPEDVATNVILQANLPSGTMQDFTVSATIKSDQTTAISSSDHGGNMVIHVTGGAQNLTFVSGSTRWFPDRATVGQIPSNGNSIVTTGLNIGSIAGCFEHSGFVTFQAQVGNISTNHDLTITKQVQNSTQGGTSLSNQVSANPGDRVHFVINFSTAGNATQDNVSVNDVLPSGLQLVTGSLRMDGNGINEGSFFGSGFSFTSLPATSTHTAIFDADVLSSASAGTTLTNTAHVRSTQVTDHQASAQVTVSGSSSNLDLSITKQVLDVTRSDSSYQDNITANAGDRVRFQIRASTSGSASQNNVIVRDILPSQISYVTGTETIDGSTVSNEFDLFGSGINLGTLPSGTTKTILFEANIAGSSAFSAATTLTNTANVRSDQVSTRQDTATINVQIISGTTFQLRKTAYNLTQGMDATTVTAHPGDIITYTLYYKNTGQNTISNVTIQDDISNIKQFSTVTNSGDALSVNGSIVYAPVTVVSGVEIAKTFQVQILPASQLSANTTMTMTNTYGNTVTVTIANPQVLSTVTPPRTGAGAWLVAIFAGMTTIGYWFFQHRKRLAA